MMVHRTFTHTDTHIQCRSIFIMYPKYIKTTITISCKVCVRIARVLNIHHIPANAQHKMWYRTRGVYMLCINKQDDCSIIFFFLILDNLHAIWIDRHPTTTPHPHLYIVYAIIIMKSSALTHYLCGIIYLGYCEL